MFIFTNTNTVRIRRHRWHTIENIKRHQNETVHTTVLLTTLLVPGCIF